VRSSPVSPVFEIASIVPSRRRSHFLCDATGEIGKKGGKNVNM